MNSGGEPDVIGWWPNVAGRYRAVSRRWPQLRPPELGPFRSLGHSAFDDSERSGRLRVEALRPGDDKRGALVMSGIPLHIQRKFEQRWAAKLASSGASAAPKNIDLKGTVNSLRAARQRPKNNPPVRSGGSIAKPELRESLAQRPMGRWRRDRSSISGGDPT